VTVIHIDFLPARRSA